MKLLTHVNNGCKASQIPCAISITLFLKSSLVAIRYAKDAINPAIAIGSKEPSPLASVPIELVIGEKKPPSFENTPVTFDITGVSFPLIAVASVPNFPDILVMTGVTIESILPPTIENTPVNFDIKFFESFDSLIDFPIFAKISPKPLNPNPLENIFENPSGIALILFSIGEIFPALLASFSHPPNACDSFPKPSTAEPVAVATAPSMATIFCCCDDKPVNQS